MRTLSWMVLMAATVMFFPASADADDWGHRHRRGRDFGFRYRSGFGRGFSFYLDDDSFHYYSPRRRIHVGPHSGFHDGPHYHRGHGYHWGPHRQRHWDLHGSRGHRRYDW